MKATLFATKLTCCWLALLLVLQSCASYKQNSISIDEAVQTKSKVKVITTSKSISKYDRIEKVDSLYYGISNTKKVIRKTPLDSSKISSIREYDKFISTLGTVILIVVPMVIFIVLATQDYGPDLEGFGM